MVRGTIVRCRSMRSLHGQIMREAVACSRMSPKEPALDAQDPKLDVGEPDKTKAGAESVSQMTLPGTKAGKIATFIFGWLYENDYVYPRTITVGYCYDDESAFLDAFEASFPGRHSPPRADTVKRRLAKYMNQLHRDGWLHKGRRYNDAYYMGEARSGWYPTYCLMQREAKRIEHGIESAADMGRRYAG